MKRKRGKYLLTQYLANQVATEVMSADDLNTKENK